MAGCIRTVLWRDEASQLYEYCAFHDTGEGIRLEGIVVAVVDARPLRITYQVVCDAQGLTRFVEVDAVGGSGAQHLQLSADDERVWRWNGRELPECKGFSDVDLGFSPATNSLPIRRLKLRIGESQALGVTWVRFPQFDVVGFPQRYTRLGPDRYRFESLIDYFQAELVVDEQGIVQQYDRFWEAVATGREC